MALWNYIGASQRSLISSRKHTSSRSIITNSKHSSIECPAQKTNLWWAPPKKARKGKAALSSSSQRIYARARASSWCATRTRWTTRRTAWLRGTSPTPSWWMASNLICDYTCFFMVSTHSECSFSKMGWSGWQLSPMLNLQKKISITYLCTLLTMLSTRTMKTLYSIRRTIQTMT